jgi:hypothetical protein
MGFMGFHTVNSRFSNRRIFRTSQTFGWWNEGPNHFWIYGWGILASLGPRSDGSTILGPCHRTHPLWLGCSFWPLGAVWIWSRTMRKWHWMLCCSFSGGTSAGVDSDIALPQVVAQESRVGAPGEAWSYCETHTHTHATILSTIKKIEPHRIIFGNPYWIISVILILGDPKKRVPQVLSKRLQDATDPADERWCTAHGGLDVTGYAFLRRTERLLGGVPLSRTVPSFGCVPQHTQHPVVNNVLSNH